MFFLPTEVQLDIFKFLNYEELCSIKQTNLYFRDFINNFEGELAREKFYEITIVYFDQCKQYPHKIIKPEADFSLNDEQLEEKFKNGLAKPIPLYLPDLDSDKTLVIRLSKGKILLNWILV
uniref:F-box domain-containing protein n=1 Tax=Meloidogyne incognita TaxID=6306 RepID=A0A914MRV4_MELIC